MNLLHARKAVTRPALAAAAERSAPILPGTWARDISIVVCLVVIIGVARATPPLSGPRAVVAWLAALVFAIAFPLGTIRPMNTTRSMAVLTGLYGLCGVAMQAVLPGGLGILMAVVAITQASRFEAPLGPSLALATGLGYAAATVAIMPAFDLGSALSSTVGLAFAYLAAANFRRLREEKHKTEALLQEVLAGRDAQVHAAALDERARIARELHDILAHTLSALAVQLEGTRLLVEQRPGDPAALEALERAARLARDGLDEARQAVGTLRGDALPGPEELPRLVTAFERDTGIPCHFSVEGEPVTLSPEARLALYRTAQEALTNVRKHAAASAVAIDLRYGPQEAELTIDDQGTPRASSVAAGGHGLSGMRERAELAHGRLEAGPTPSGFKVHLWLPA